MPRGAHQVELDYPSQTLKLDLGCQIFMRSTQARNENTTKESQEKNTRTINILRETEHHKRYPRETHLRLSLYDPKNYNLYSQLLKAGLTKCFAHSQLNSLAFLNLLKNTRNISFCYHTREVPHNLWSQCLSTAFWKAFANQEVQSIYRVEEEYFLKNNLKPT